MQPAFDRRLESAVVSRLMWRLMPFLFLLYIVAYLDRINVSFAFLQMRDRLHITDAVYGRAAGLFFAGYFLFQLPSNLLLQKVGVRRWIAALMAAWGLVSCSMIFIRGPVSFYLLRFLLGAMEAGFFPGMIFHMKNWFPARARGRAVAWFMTANPIAGIVGSPISGALLGIHARGLAGWQWLFLLEGVPAIVLGMIVLGTLVDRPQEADWLSTEQRGWLIDQLELERQPDTKVNLVGVMGAIFNVRIWALSGVYFGVSACMYGVTLWLPSLIRALSGLSYFMTSLTAMIPFVATVVAMVLVGMHSDATGERRWHTAVPAFLGAGALILAAYGQSTALVIAGLGLGMAGAEAMVGPFWAMATSQLEGIAAAAGIAVINSLANLGGYFGPDIIGMLRSANGGFRGGLLAIAAVLVASGAIGALVGATGERDLIRSTHAGGEPAN